MCLPDSENESVLLYSKQDSLAAKLRAGNRAAAEEFVDLYYRRIYLYLRRLGHNQNLSEELTQECFLRFWRHLGQLRDGRSLDCWLYSVAGNVARAYWRRNRGRQTISIELTELPENIDSGFEQAGYNEQLNRVKTAVERLPLKLRQAIVLHYMQQLTIDQAAVAAGIRKGTFKSRLHRALKAIRKEVGLQSDRKK